MSNYNIEQAIDAAAKALWESETHPLMKKAGHATDWENLNESVKKSIRRKAWIAVKAFNADVERQGGAL